MRRKNFVCFLCATSFLQLIVLAASETDPVISPTPDFTRLQQFQGQPPVDLRQQLSASQQDQILSDVQQHQGRFDVSQQESVVQNQQTQVGPFANQEVAEQKSQESSTQFPSLAKYRVDRVKQQQKQQQQLQEQHHKIGQQIGQNFLQTAHAQYQSQPQPLRQPYQAALTQQQYTQFQTIPNNFQAAQQDLTQPLFNDEQALQLQNYFEKQRQLEILQRQREQLILEQQELRRQQELLRLHQLQQLTSTTTTPILSSSSSSLLLSSPSSRKITPAESNLFLKAIASHQKKFSSTTRSTTPKPTTTTTTIATTTSKLTSENQLELNQEENLPKDVLSLIQAQESQVNQQGTPKPQFKLVYESEKPPSVRPRFSVKNKSIQSTSSSPIPSERDLLLKQLKYALTQSPIDDIDRNVTTRDLILPNGKKLQVIHAPNSLSSIVPSSTPSSITTTTTTTIKPPKTILEELTKGVLPPGADFEVIRHKDDGKLEDVGKLPIQSLPAKKVTFVVLEEQLDGSYKVQGVKGNTEKDNGGDLASIVERIKNGELKLPPSSHNPTASSLSSTTALNLAPTAQSSVVSSVTINALPTTTRSNILPTISGTSDSKYTDYSPFVTVSPNVDYPTENHVSSASTTSGHVFNSLQTLRTTPRSSNIRGTESYTLATTKYPSSSRNQFVTTAVPPTNDVVTSTAPSSDHTSTFANSNSYVHYTSPTPRSISTTLKSISNAPVRNVIYEEKFERKRPLTTIPTIEESISSDAHFGESLSQVLKREGLYAMAKFLRQSGLDSVLNETGPYTVFVPTDKAFRTLLVQLGGPEKAEQKFRDNPRLLSGLLLHHVIPGAFRIDSLQDEMTGVSLAGTQLRVNVYPMQDHEWNDVRVTTINGARVAPDKKDFEIPQGIAHAIDRVMFPLPVGDLVQTLQADRERRFTTFLKILHLSGLEETLAGSKTFTVFAPTDTAFVTSAAQNGSPSWSDADGPEAAKKFISKHVMPTTLYTAGMRYYQQKDTLHSQSPLHIHKNGGRVRINEAKVVTHNVPATNGVIHAIDAVL